MICAKPAQYSWLVGGIHFGQYFLFFLTSSEFCNSAFLADAKHLRIEFDGDGMIMIVNNDTVNQYTLSVTDYETLW